MRKRPQQPEGSQSGPQDIQRGTGAPGSTSGATGASSAGMQDTGSYQQPDTGYQQQGGTYQQQGGTYQQGGSYQQQGGTYQQGATYQQPAGSYQQGGTYQQQGGQMEPYGRGQDYGTSGDYGRPTPSRHGAGLAILAGSLAFLEGLAFVIRGHYYRYTVAGYAYRWTLHGWGWVLLILGAILVAAGVSHLLGIKGSRHFAAAVAVITAVVAFLTIFYSVIWGILVLAVSAFAAHALLSQRDDERYGAGGGSAGYGGSAGQQSYQGTSQRDEAMAGQGGSHRRMLGASCLPRPEPWSVPANQGCWSPAGGNGPLLALPARLGLTGRATEWARWRELSELTRAAKGWFGC